MEYPAPSGLKLDLGKIDGKTLIDLAENASSKSFLGGFDRVLSRCHRQTLDAGPYSFIETGDAKPDWSRLLKGDSVALFIFLRAISMPQPEGRLYAFPVTCAECGKRYEWTIDLIDQLPRKELPESSAAQMRTGQPFSTKLPDGRVVRFDLQVPAQDEALAAFLKKRKRGQITDVDRVAAQTVSISGVKDSFDARHDAIASLDMDEIYGLRAEFEAVDCGIDTEIEVRCPMKRCEHEQAVTLPLDRNFFTPPKKRPTSSTQSSEGSTSTTSGGSSTVSSGTNTGEAATI